MTTRRALLTAGATAPAVLLATAGSASAKRADTPPALLHLINRATYGWTPGVKRQIDVAGGQAAWLNKQLKAGYSNTFYATSRTWWESLNLNDSQLRERDSNEVESLWSAGANYRRWVLLRRIHSPNQLKEHMCDFWENHLHVPITGGAETAWRTQYGDVIYKHALGKYSDLLFECITHPAMGLYLSNAQSTKTAPNENLGRELLELHTLGLGAGYTEQDVRNSSYILTGWYVDAWRTWKTDYRPDLHWTGKVKVLDFTHDNANPDGREVTKLYLSWLAKHPATAQRLAYKLAVRFVSDTPTTSMVNALAKVYLDNDTAIAPVLKTLFNHPDFIGGAGKKLKTPEEDVVSTYRALGIKVHAPTGGDSGANQILWQTQNVGLMPFDWPQPNGRPETAGAWDTTKRFFASLDQHYSLAGGWWPTKEVTHPSYASWMPKDQIVFSAFIDHINYKLTGKKADSIVKQACSQAVGYSLDETITKGHALVKWGMPRLLTTMLDAPQFFMK